mgnify:CR=1 FL=1
MIFVNINNIYLFYFTILFPKNYSIFFGTGQYIVEFIPMLKEEAKFRIIDPQELLSPIPADGEYKDLISYLQTRYWKK